MRSFNSLSEREILARAISLEEEDERVYADYAERPITSDRLLQLTAASP